VAFTETTEETDGGGSSIGYYVFLDELSITGWSGVDRGRLEYSGGDAVEKRSVDDVPDQM
jgi:hypothetical protein